MPDTSDSLPHRRCLDTPLGPMLAGATAEGVARLDFIDVHPPSPATGSSPHLDALEDQLAQYFAGTLTRFTVPLHLRGTEFQRLVWAQLLAIPFGQTRSYLQQARAIGRPTATRAVAGANGDNPIAILIPCHRVIGSDGSLTGYGGRLWRKQWLLEHEGALAPSLLA